MKRSTTCYMKPWRTAKAGTTKTFQQKIMF